MVISFSNSTAFDYLVEHGYVATFRKNRRKNKNHQTWLNRGRGKSKEFDVQITELGKASSEDGDQSTVIADFAHISGFMDPVSWRDAVKKINGEVPETGWVYLVTRISTF